MSLPQNGVLQEAHKAAPAEAKEKSLETFVSRLFYLVEISGIEPLTS